MKAEEATTVLEDERFKGLFTNPDFQVDENSEHYQQTQQAILKFKAKKLRLAKKNGVSESSSENEVLIFTDV